MRIDDHRNAEHWATGDTYGMFQQLGAVPGIR